MERINQRIVKLSTRGILVIFLFTEVLFYLILIPFSYLKDHSLFDFFAYGSPYTRIFSMFSGILICDLYYKGRRRLNNNTLWEVVTACIALLWIYNMRVYYEPHENYSVRYPVVAIINNLISLAIVYVFSFENGAISRFLHKKVLITLGGCVMYIYILHYPVIYNVYGVINQLLSMTMVVKIFTVVLIFLVTGVLTFIVWKYDTKVMHYIDSQ